MDTPTNLLSNPEDLRFIQYHNWTRATANEYSLQLDSHVVDHPDAVVFGSISAQDYKTNPWTLFCTNSESRPIS
jgi:hypothetical protein